MVAILRKAKGIKARLESLDRMWLIEMYISYKEGSLVDRMRIWVTTVLERTDRSSAQIRSREEGKAELAMENQERQEALKDLQRSLTELHQVFLDMAVMVVKQGEQMDDIEQNVADAGAYIHGGTNALYSAQLMKQRRGRWACWIGALVLIVLLWSFGL
ncbi:unnamed protein product [Prunus armeniaca]